MIEDKIKELEAHVRKLVKEQRIKDINILKMLDDLPDVDDLVKIKLIKEDLLRRILQIMAGELGCIDIKSLINKSKTPIERRLDNIE